MARGGVARVASGRRLNPRLAREGPHPESPSFIAARTLTFTDASASYLHEIEYLFERLDTATRELRARAGRRTLRLRVASFFASEFLLPRLAALHAAQPEIDLEIDTDGTGFQAPFAE